MKRKDVKRKDDQQPAGPHGNDPNCSDAEETTEANVELARVTGAAEMPVETTSLEDASEGSVEEHPSDVSAEEKAERILRDGRIWL